MLKPWRSYFDNGVGNSDIVVLRCDSSHRASYMIPFIKESGFVPVDVCDWNQINFGSMESGGVVNCAIQGRPINSFAGVLYFGAPEPNKDEKPLVAADRGFVSRERNQAMLALLTQAQRFINKGYWENFNRILSWQETQLRVLSSIGWDTPTASWVYDFEKNETKKKILPEPVEPVLIVLTPTQHVAVPEIKLNVCCLGLIKKTQNFMRAFALDWCVIPVDVGKHSPCAHGLSPNLPECLPTGSAANLIRETFGVCR